MALNRINIGTKCTVRSTGEIGIIMQIYFYPTKYELEFSDGETIHLEEGDSVYIPGFMPHNEIRTSDAFELLEFSVPAEMGTETCDPPAN